MLACTFGDCREGQKPRGSAAGFLTEIMNSGKKILCGSEVHQHMGILSQEAMKITARINCGYHEPEEIRELFSLLTGREVDESFGMFPPFYTDCGKNIHIGRNVFFNGGCRFQDQGGIYIDDGALIGPMVVLATLNHEQDPEHRGDIFPKPIRIGKMYGSGQMPPCCRELPSEMGQS